MAQGGSESATARHSTPLAPRLGSHSSPPFCGAGYYASDDELQASSRLNVTAEDCMVACETAGVTGAASTGGRHAGGRQGRRARIQQNLVHPGARRAPRGPGGLPPDPRPPLPPRP